MEIIFISAVFAMDDDVLGEDLNNAIALIMN